MERFQRSTLWFFVGWVTSVKMKRKKSGKIREKSLIKVAELNRKNNSLRHVTGAHITWLLTGTYTDNNNNKKHITFVLIK